MSKNNVNKIVYIEPNDLPGESVNVADGQVADNITWQPEELNISVDLQVVIPSRLYRENKSDESFANFFTDISQSKYQSILSGEKLTTEDGVNFQVLTDNFTNIGYQEIKNNNAGSKEMLGINSININFDSHLYPRVTINFTDVRGASLMMPQELYYTSEDKNTACKNFFASFFKFPYPRFLLSVKGVYGTTVTFVLSVEDFKANFNSETGNFDIIVTFIGNMYGLYTDIPMNYLIVAPYINGIGGEPNEYWKKQTSTDGTFFYVEDNAQQSQPIRTLMEFRHDYKTFIDDKDNPNAFEGESIMEIAKAQKRIRVINSVVEDYDKIPYNIRYDSKSFTIEDKDKKDVKHLIFQLDEKRNYDFIFNSAFVKDFAKKALDAQKVVSNVVPKDEKSLVIPLINGDTIIGLGSDALFFLPVQESFLIAKNNSYEISNAGKTVLKDILTDKEIQILEKQINISQDSSRLISSPAFLFYKDSDYRDLLTSAIDEQNKIIENNEQQASKDLNKSFKNTFGFTPSIENIMRMIFAHIDCFMHEMYTVLSQIKTDRTARKYNINGTYTTDIETSSTNGDYAIPPFTGFYEENEKEHGRLERIYPDDVKNDKGEGLIEIDFVENIFNGIIAEINTAAKEEEEGRRAKINGEYGTSPSQNFIPTCITDFYYDGINPYNYFSTDIVSYPSGFISYFLARFHRGIQGFKAEDKEINANATDPKTGKQIDNGTAIVLTEIKNIKASNLWDKMVKDEKFVFSLESLFAQAEDMSEASKGKADFDNIIFKTTLQNKKNGKFIIEKKDGNDGKDYIIFRGNEILNTGNTHYLTEVDDNGNVSKGANQIPILSHGTIDGWESRLSSFANVSDSGYFSGTYKKHFKVTEEKYRLMNGTVCTNTLSLISFLHREKSTNKYVPFIKEGENFVPYKNDGNNIVCIKPTYPRPTKINTANPRGNQGPSETLLQIMLPTDKGQKTVEEGLKIFSEDYVWVPFVAYMSKCNILIDKETPKGKNPIFLGEEYNKYEKAFFFLACLYVQCNIDWPDVYKTSGVYREPLILKYFIGAYYFIISNYPKSKILKIVNDYLTIGVKAEKRNVLPKIKDKYIKFEIDGNDETIFSKDFLEWVNDNNNGFGYILNEVTTKDNLSKYKADSKVAAGTGWNISSWNLLKTADEYTEDNSSRLQSVLIKLLKEQCYIFVTPYISSKAKELEQIDKAYLQKFLSTLKNEIEKERATEEEEEKPTPQYGNGENRSADNNQKNSLYYTLKNLYDRWLASYREENFKLRAPSEINEYRDAKKGNKMPSTLSDFDNFLYVDSFYNNIGNKFYVNPSTFFDILNGQIVGDSNFSAYEFIARICEKNKLLLQCLPVYNALYNVKTFEEIFKPHSLYSAETHLGARERIGNTYVIMYTYETSHHLTMPHDKKNDVGYSGDGFSLTDAQGNIDATLIRTVKGTDKNDYDMCAFGVTVGRQNQSYFTKISVGMDNPRVTDFSIYNLFKLADLSKGGRAEGIGAGQDMYSIYSNRAYDCKVEMLGCANIMPMMYFQLNNIPMFHGVYMIKKVEHNIQNNTMTTTFTGTKMSNRFIPFNTTIFNLDALADRLNAIAKIGIENMTYQGYEVEISKDGEIRAEQFEWTPTASYLAKFNRLPEPESTTAVKRFNVWAALEQMKQCLWNAEVVHGTERYTTPLLSSSIEYHNAVTEANRGICATAVEMFLMAGWYGVFYANNPTQGSTVNNYRSTLKINNTNFMDKNGYKMKDKLESFGFQVVAKNRAEIRDMESKGTLMPGDICVMRHPDEIDGTATESEKPGHVCMYNGEYWVSDFRQTKAKSQDFYWVYTGIEPPSGDYEVMVYRMPDDFVEYTPGVAYGKWVNGNFVINENN